MLINELINHFTTLFLALLNSNVHFDGVGDVCRFVIFDKYNNPTLLFMRMYCVCVSCECDAIKNIDIFMGYFWNLTHHFRLVVIFFYIFCIMFGWLIFPFPYIR